MRFTLATRRIVHRLADRRKWPRSLWYPLPRDLSSLGAENLGSVHRQVSSTVNTILFIMIGFSLFSVFTLLGESDVDLIAHDSRIRVPIPLLADYDMSFSGFLVAGPLALVAIAATLHVFLVHWMVCSRDKRLVEMSPFIFNLPYRSSRVISGFLFYWLPSVVLGVYFWKVRWHPEFSMPLCMLLLAVTVISLCIQIRRCPEGRRNLNVLRWITLLILVLLGWGFLPPDSMGPLSYVVPRPQEIWRLDLRGNDLSGKNLAGVSLRDAKLAATRFDESILVGADLSRSDLSFASVMGADLQGATLEYAQSRSANYSTSRMEISNLSRSFLVGATFDDCNLSFARLKWATLIGARLRNANLTGADLMGAQIDLADLSGANLLFVRNLTQTQLDSACVDEPVQNLSKKLAQPPPCLPRSRWRFQLRPPLP